MNEAEIISKVYERGRKCDGLLMACYSKEIFSRDYIEDIVRQYHASLTAINTGIDHLLENFNEHDSYITCIGKNKFTKRNQYTITPIGEQLLYSRFPDLAYQMACLIDEGKPEYKLFTRDEEKTFDEDDTRDKIEEECARIASILLDKNERYGNSSLQPFGLFKSVKKESKIEARIEDKLKRIQKFASEDDKHCKDYEDAVDDLIGYLILYRIALRD